MNKNESNRKLHILYRNRTGNLRQRRTDTVVNRFTPSVNVCETGENLDNHDV
jgi:hypothetical protein